MPKQNSAGLGPLCWLMMVLIEIVRRLFQPARGSVMLASVVDLSRSRAAPIAENALLRQQLANQQRQTKRPQLTTADRFSLLVLAKWVRTWRQVLLIVQPETLLRRHRRGFRLFWKLRSTGERQHERISNETIEPIHQMAKENRL